MLWLSGCSFSHKASCAGALEIWDKKWLEATHSFCPSTPMRRKFKEVEFPRRQNKKKAIPGLQSDSGTFHPYTVRDMLPAWSYSTGKLALYPCFSWHFWDLTSYCAPCPGCWNISSFLLVVTTQVHLHLELRMSGAGWVGWGSGLLAMNTKNSKWRNFENQKLVDLFLDMIELKKGEA